MKSKILLLLILTLIIPLSTANPTTIEIHPTEINIDAGEYFNISFIVKPAETINTIATDHIYWTVGTLECVKIQQGTIFPDTVMFLGGTINNKIGEIKNIVWASQNRTNISGVFINLTFRAIKGETDITIDPAKYGIANNGIALERTISNSCHITIIGDATPLIRPLDISLEIWSIVILFILLVVSTTLLFYHEKKKKKPKKEKTVEKEPKIEEPEDDLFS